MAESVKGKQGKHNIQNQYCQTSYGGADLGVTVNIFHHQWLCGFHD